MDRDESYTPLIPTDSFKSKIRREVMKGNSSIIKEILLSEEELKLVNYLTINGNTTTHDLTVLHNISSQNASSKLNKLYQKGYLNRRERTAASGGNEFIYFPKTFL